MNWKKYVIENFLKKEGDDYNQFKFEIKQKLFEELTSGEEFKILNASRVLIHLDNLNFSHQELGIIEKKCSNLPKSKRKMISDYREDVNAGLMVLKNFGKGEICKCKIYPNWIQFSPEREIEMGFLKLEGIPIINKEEHQKEVAHKP